MFICMAFFLFAVLYSLKVLENGVPDVGFGGVEIMMSVV